MSTTVTMIVTGTAAEQSRARNPTSATGSSATARDAAWTSSARRETIAAAIAETIGNAVDYQPVEADGAARAAALIAPLLEEHKGRRPLAPYPRRPPTPS